MAQKSFQESDYNSSMKGYLPKNEGKPPKNPKNQYDFTTVNEKPPPTSINDNYQVRASAMKSGYQDRLKTGMKSNAPAGFKDKVQDKSAKVQSQVLQPKIKTEEDQFKDIERNK